MKPPLHSLLVLLCCSFSQSLAAKVLDLRGSVGALNTWALLVHLQPPAPGEPAQTYSGPMSLRHTGLCAADGHTTKNGTATATVKGTRLYALELKFEDEDCVLAGPIKVAPNAEHDFMRCSKGMQVPISIWSDDP